MPQLVCSKCQEDSSRVSYYKCPKCKILCEKCVQPPYTETGDFWKNIVAGIGAVYQQSAFGDSRCKKCYQEDVWDSGKTERIYTPPSG